MSATAVAAWGPWSARCPRAAGASGRPALGARGSTPQLRPGPGPLARRSPPPSPSQPRVLWAPGAAQVHRRCRWRTARWRGFSRRKDLGAAGLPHATPSKLECQGFAPVLPFLAICKSLLLVFDWERHAKGLCDAQSIHRSFTEIWVLILSNGQIGQKGPNKCWFSVKKNQ